VKCLASISGLCTALLIATPAGAVCTSLSCVTAPVTPTIAVPPIALHQIDSASQPMRMAALPPAASHDPGPNEPPMAMTPPPPPAIPVPPSGIASVSGLDGGASAWHEISPLSAEEPLTAVAPLHPAPRAQPLPPRTEIALSDQLRLAVPVTVRPPGVPGIDRDSAAGGNRSLWFAPHENR